MKKEILQSIKIISLALVFGIAVSYLSFGNSKIVSSDSHTCITPESSSLNNPGSFPDSNPCRPIDKGNSVFEKSAGLSVAGFLASQDSQFAQKLSVLNTQLIQTDPETAIHIEALTVKGVDNTLGKMRVSSLTGNEGKQLCADSEGKLFICDFSIDGACGASDGQFVTSPPTNLCNSGIASTPLPIQHIYSWNCSGINGGNPDYCSANIAVTASFTQNKTGTECTDKTYQLTGTSQGGIGSLTYSYTKSGGGYPSQTFAGNPRTFLFDRPGPTATDPLVYNINLTVTDSNGNSGNSVTHTVSAGPCKPGGNYNDSDCPAGCQ
ncbi:MAG: hypothetical protein WDK96_01135 [Candidatus Paceibacterota bacterium]|jgi:hypothetical protein